MSKMIRIQSTTTINVTCGLQHKDMTNPDAHIPDRLKVSPEWSKCTVLVTEGVGNYPAEIATWGSVKALVDAKVFTLGEIFESDNADDVAMVTEFERKMSTVETTEHKRRNKKTLEGISE